MATCEDLRKNEAGLKKIAESLWTLRAGPSPTALILPWFPTPAMAKIMMAYYKMTSIIRDHIEARRPAEPTNDAVDVLIAEGETTQEIVQVRFFTNVWTGL